MAQWMIWLSLAGAVTILELFSGTFYLLMMAIGLGTGALAAYFGALLEVQFIIAATTGIVAMTILRRSRIGQSVKVDARRDANINLDIGQAIEIQAWHPLSVTAGRPTARVMYRGAQWDVELVHGGQALPGRYVIREIEGSKLIVSSQF